MQERICRFWKVIDLLGGCYHPPITLSVVEDDNILGEQWVEQALNCAVRGRLDHYIVGAGYPYAATDQVEGEGTLD